jgi:DNA invertase Pin-like site-specific DNA recombinase
MIQLIKEFDAMGVAIRFLDGGISTEGTMGKMVVTILSPKPNASAYWSAPTRAAWKPRLRGGKFGCKPTVDKAKVRALHRQGLGATEIARPLKIGRSKVYKVLA